MKQLTILLLLIIMIGCKKEPIDPNPVNIIPPQDVYYTVKTRTNAPKHIVCKLYAADLVTKEQRQLIGQIDTITTLTNITLILKSNVKPVMYCYGSLIVNVLDNKYDTFYIEIANDKDFLVSRGGTCQTDFYDIQDMFLQLMANK